ncbi:MAG: homocysteine S-methyltransferase family protein [Pseudomonadota bacterium]
MNDQIFLTEGGTETEIMFRHGFDFPQFAVFELLKDPEATAVLRDMYRRLLDVIAASGCNAHLAGLDYRASPDWGAVLGYSPEGLAEVQARCIDFLREVSRPYESRIPEIRIAGGIGPRGDAYELNEAITEETAEDYHSVQLETLKALGVTEVWGATFNNVPEAVGLARAAHRLGLRLCLSFTLTAENRLRSGPSLKEAIEATDQRAGTARPDHYGLNCSHPLEFLPALEPGDWIERLRNIRPNAAAMDKIALCKLNHLEDGDPVELGQQIGDLARRYPHIDTFGGCCGCWETHLREMANGVKAARASVPA